MCSTWPFGAWEACGGDGPFPYGTAMVYIDGLYLQLKLEKCPFQDDRTQLWSALRSLPRGEAGLCLEMSRPGLKTIAGVRAVCGSRRSRIKAFGRGLYCPQESFVAEVLKIALCNDSSSALNVEPVHVGIRR